MPFMSSRLPQPQAGGDEGKLLVISADGKGIVMHPNGLREATRRAMEQEEHKQHTRLSPGEKKNRKRMATVVSVYEVDPYPRTAEQILERDTTARGESAATGEQTHLGPRGGRSRDGDRAGLCRSGAP